MFHVTWLIISKVQWHQSEGDFTTISQLSLIKISLGSQLNVLNRFWDVNETLHYDDVIMTAMASQITSLMIVYSTVYSGAYQTKHQSSASLALCGEFTGTGEFPAQRANNVENVSIWWRHHVLDFSTRWPHDVFPITGTHRSPVVSIHKGTVMHSFYIFFGVRLNKLPNKQCWGRGLEKSMLKSMLFNKDFLSRLLIGWRLCCQPARCQELKIFVNWHGYIF